MTENRETTTFVQRGPAVQILDLRRGADNFSADVRAGLTSTPKTLSPRYFYDDLGSFLFEAICRLDEYYVTRAEDEILRTSSDEIIAALPDPIRLVELGCGTAVKTRHVIDAALRRQPALDYFPIDIDGGTLGATAEALSAEYGALRITGIAASFDDGLHELEARLATADSHTLVLFLGSTIGNLDPEGQREILQSVRRALRPGDALLLGADRVKSEDVLIPAYDDPPGVTAAFNRNLLVRINRELGGTFDVRSFNHEARYDRQRQRIEMHLVSTVRQTATVRAAGIEVEFAEGESIHTESSYKFTRDAIELLARDTRFALARQWTDRQSWFGDNLLLAV